MKIASRAGVFAALYFAVCATGASAQTEPSAAPSPSPAASPASLPEIVHVFTSDRHTEPISDTTRPTFVVDRKTIENFGSRSVSEALEYVPGVNIFSYGAFGSASNYGIRGTTSAQTLVLRDGIPITLGSIGSIDVGSLSTLGIQRIEIVESGSSTLYGSNASGGVINLISATSAAQPYVRLSSGTYGNNDVAAQVGTPRLSVSFERHVANNVYDYPAFNYPGAAAQPAGTRTNGDALQSTLRLAYSTKLADDWTARLSGGSSALNLGLPGSLAFGATPDNRQESSQSDGQLDLTHSAGAGTLTFTAAGSAQRLAYIDRGPYGGQSDTYDSRTQASVRYASSAAKSNLVTGIDLIRATAELSSGGPLGFPSFGAAQSQAAAYAQFGYAPAPATRLTFGVRAENDSPQAGAVAPSLGVSAGAGQARISANVAESFRVPTFDELYYPGFGNPNLVPERLSNYDVTVAFPAVGGGLSFGYFGRNGSNLISTVCDVTFTCRPVNVSRASVNGLQFTASTRPYNHFRFNASITNLYRALGFDGTNVEGRLPNTPAFTATLGLERGFDGGPVAFGARVLVAGARLADGPLEPNPYDGYTNAEAYVRYRFASHGIASLRVNNLANERYEPVYGYPAPGRTITLEFATR